MNELLNIRESAQENNACEAQFKPFCQAIDNDNELLAWQIVLGNKVWLLSKNIELPVNLEELANGIGLNYYTNGQLRIKSNWQNGQRHGLSELWYKNGQLRIKSNWQNGQRHGLFEWWYKNGQLLGKSNWQNGQRHGLFEWWYENGQLREKSNWQNGQRQKN